MPSPARSTSTSQVLRVQTRARHDRLEQLPYFQRLLSGNLPLASYVGHLRALAIAHAVLEHGLEESADPVVKSVWRDDMRKWPLLERDIAFLSPRVSSGAAAVGAEAALQVTESMRRTRATNEPALLGYVYVLEGSILGAKRLRPLVAQTFALSMEDGLHYLNNYGPQAENRWAEFRRRLDTAVSAGPLREQLINVACQAFDSLAAVFEALDPSKESTASPLAATINPEAGRHPIPSDPREINAALRAAERCLAEFPYFESRYGERGRRFAQSDSAWLATLCDLDEDQLTAQVLWLGRVLATRGMPRITLEVHLSMLHRELLAAIPDKRASYGGLLTASRHLRSQRLSQLDEARWQSLVQQFDSRSDPRLLRQLPRAADLLLAAVSDEAAGIEGAVESIEIWLADENRFPPPWCARVRETICAARAVVAHKGNSE